jgi:hypothetical protein
MTFPRISKLLIGCTPEVGLGQTYLTDGRNRSKGRSLDPDDDDDDDKSDTVGYYLLVHSAV